MQELPQWPFDVYALALPRGHGFGHRPPVGAWQSADGDACGVVTRDVDNSSLGVLIMRRRVDLVWTVTKQEHGFVSMAEARGRVESLLREGDPAEPDAAQHCGTPRTTGPDGQRRFQSADDAVAPSRADP
jgi:hypothetical protein